MYRRQWAAKVAWNERGAGSACHARSTPGRASLMAARMSCREGKGLVAICRRLHHQGPTAAKQQPRCALQRAGAGCCPFRACLERRSIVPDGKGNHLLQSVHAAVRASRYCQVNRVRVALGFGRPLVHGCAAAAAAAAVGLLCRLCRLLCHRRLCRRCRLRCGRRCGLLCCCCPPRIEEPLQGELHHLLHGLPIFFFHVLPAAETRKEGEEGRECGREGGRVSPAGIPMRTQSSIQHSGSSVTT